MPLKFICDDITKISCDAIVNAANNSLLGGGGVDGAIHKAAGSGLLDECRKLGGCETGQAKITGAYNLPCKYVIHTVGPVYRNGRHSERELLTLCYKNSLLLAKKYNCNSVAFPVISSGAYGYPFADALKVALDTVRDFLINNELTVYIVIFDKKNIDISEKPYSEVKKYIDFKYAGEYYDEKVERLRRAEFMLMNDTLPENMYSSFNDNKQSVSLKDALTRIDEDFHQMLSRKISEKEIGFEFCSRKANLDSRFISDMFKNKTMPEKYELIQIAFALELSFEELKDLLNKAGYSLSYAYIEDVITEYFITEKNYNVYELLEAIFIFDAAE
ncbi:MAG: macro domain-containing protein [Ruminococcus sp.]|nr:macro domain-containing protein [Candidatus Copronaster equi]